MKKTTLLSAVLLLSAAVFAQVQTETTSLQQLEEKVQDNTNTLSKLKNLKVSGYIQTQYQWGEEDASLKVGTGNEHPDQAFNRIGVRRGRIKFAYSQGIASGVFQLDLTEKGIGFKDAYLQIKDPWTGRSSLKAGIFDRTFGNEISYSSSRRESPERSTLFQTLFPDERDVGAALTLQTAKTSPLHFLKLEAGLFSGNGIKRDTDSKKDFIGHLSASDQIGKNATWGLGVSYYHGSVYQGTENVFTFNQNTFELHSEASNKGAFSKREYVGIDAQFTLNTAAGKTQLRGEYLFGTQPGVNENSKSPNASTLSDKDTYVRNFDGGYAILIQDLGKSNLSAVMKYDWYNPNTKISGDAIGLNNTNKGDISYNTLGLGMLWHANKNIRLQAYYEFVKNETSQNLTGYETDRKDNTFTLRLQYKF